MGGVAHAGRRQAAMGRRLRRGCLGGALRMGDLHLGWALRGKRRHYKRSRYGRFPPFEQQSARPVPDRTEVRGTAYVVDGDTLVIQQTQIRLFGIDAPELDHPHGKNAREQ